MRKFRSLTSFRRGGAGSHVKNASRECGQIWRVELTQQLEAAEPAHGPAISRGFFRDVLSDAEGYSLHRFQLLAWTIALGVVFVSAVYNDLIMPEFNATMLGLMGMSSGVYIGLKVSEKRGRVMERVESAPLHPLAS